MKKNILYMIVFGLSIGTASAQPAAEEFYSLNETSGQAIDKQGHNNSKEVKATQGVAGKIGTCYLFNGTTDKVTFADSDNWTLKKTDNFSLSAWISFTADNKAQWGTIWGNAADIGVGVKKISAGSYGIFWYAGSSVPTSTTFTMTPGEWYHIVVVKTSNTSVNFYLNNVLLKTAAPGDQDVNPSAVYIGGNEMSNEYFNGKIDEVGIWKTVLTASDIAALYNAVPTRLS